MEVLAPTPAAAPTTVAPPTTAPPTGATVVLGAAPRARQPRARVRLLQQGAEQEIVLSGAETIFGREPNNPIAIRDAQSSRRHGRIFVENGEFWFEDLKGLNGTRINGEITTTRHKLVTGDQIKVGEAVMTFFLDAN